MSQYIKKIVISCLFLVSSSAYAYEIIDSVTTTTQRVTNASDATVYTPAYIRHEYSRRPAFNVDSSRAVMTSSNGFLHLYQVGADGSFTYSHILDQIGTANSEPNWHPTDPNLIYVLNPFGVGMQIHLYDVRDQSLQSTTDLGSVIQALGGGFATADRAYTGKEGRPSRDGNIWCFTVFSGESWEMRGMVAYDLSLNQIVASRETSEWIDAISASVNGDYCVALGGNGIRSYPISDNQFNTFRQIHQQVEHTDMALDADGRDVLVYIDSLNDGHIKAVDLATGETAMLLNTWDISPPPAAHMSGIGYAQPGWAIVSMFMGNNTTFHYNKVLAIELTSNPRIEVLADNQHLGNSAYFLQPQAVVNQQLDKVLYASDISGELASYLVSIEQALPTARGILEGGTTPPDDPPPPSGDDLTITTDETIYFQQDGDIQVSVQTSRAAQCRWDYSDGNSYPFAALSMDLTTNDDLTHTFSEYAWNDHTLYVVCQAADDNSEAEQLIQVVRGDAPPEGLAISGDNPVYFPQEGFITIDVTTSVAADCRWDYADGNNYPFDVLYQDMSTADNLTHSLTEYAWADHELIVVCQAQDDSEATQFIDVLSGSPPAP